MYFDPRSWLSHLAAPWNLNHNDNVSTAQNKMSTLWETPASLSSR